MKYLIVIGDGMADRPIKEIGNKTLLEYSHTPNLDQLALRGSGGLVQTIPAECEPGSDVANLSILGFDPTKYYTGRAPLEAVSMGIKLSEGDIAFRCNLVTVDGDRMTDYSAGHIDTVTATKVINFLKANLLKSSLEFHPGVSYRHLMLYRNGPEGWGKGKLKTTPPHDFTGKVYAKYLPKGEEAGRITHIMNQSLEALKKCDVNNELSSQGKARADMIWLWGQGGAVNLPSLSSTYQLQGSVISAVDLVRGIGTSAGLDVETVKGATGYLDTNYQGKVDRALSVLKNKDFVFLHVEAPDEAGHSGKWELKKRAIEDFDAKVVGPLLVGLSKGEAFRLLVMPDHATPIETKTHSREAVPFLIYPSPNGKSDAMKVFTENDARNGSMQIKKGHQLMNILIGGQ